MAPGGVWDHKADKDLLLAIIAEGQLKGIIWPTVAAKMQAKGYTFTKEGCRQHFQKIRKEAGGGNDDGTTPVRNSVAKPPKPPKTTNSAKSTPRKAKSMTESFSTSDSSFGNGQTYEDDEEDMSTPLKRKRVTKKEGLEADGRNAPLFKMENQGGKEGPIDLEHEDLYEYEDGYV